MATLHSHSAALRFIRFSMLGLIVATSARAADAQLTPEEKTSLGREKTSLRIDVSKMHRDGTINDDGKLTRSINIDLQLIAGDPDISDLPSKRNKVLQELRQAGNAPNQAVHKKMTDMYLPGLEKIARDASLSMPVRYNAALLLANLNEVEPPNFGTSVKPVALSEALPVQLAMWADPDVEDAIRAAVMIGLVQQAEARPAGQPGDDLRTMLFTLLQEAVPPQGRSQSGHEWFRRHAAIALGRMGQLGNGGGTQILQALIDITKDSNSTFMLRCDAARAIGNLQYGGNLNYAQVAQPLATLANEVIQQHGNKPGDKTNDRRAIKHYLNCVIIGMRGPDPDATGGIAAAVSDAEQKTFVTGALTLIDGLSQILDSNDTAEIAVQKVKQQGADLDNFLQQNKAPGNSLGA